MFHLTDFYSYMAALFAVANPVGSGAIFIALTGEKTEKERKKLAITSTLAIVVIWMIVVWSGDYILRFFGITVSAFQVAGGLIITLIGLSMLQSKDSGPSQSPEEEAHVKKKASIAVVPLAIPIVAGPGSITSIIVYVHKYSEPLINKLYFSLGAIGIAILIFIFFYFSAPISKILGPSGAKIATGIMGLILVAIAMVMIGDGLRHMLPGLA